jgi:DNA-binding MarR family transcriptional regulator
MDKRATVCQMLFTAARLVDERAQARVNREAGRKVMRPAYARLVPYLGTEGVRLTELARRVDLSKQAVAQTLAELERDGLVVMTPDPSDGRAKLVRLSRQGVAAVMHGIGVLGEIERELGEAVGPARLGALREALAGVLDVLEATPPPAPPPARPARKARGTAGGRGQRRDRPRR